jgi:hypothetical protein
MVCLLYQERHIMKLKLIILLFAIFQLKSVGIGIEKVTLLEGHPLHGLEIVEYEAIGLGPQGLYQAHGAYLRVNPTIALNNAGILGFCTAGICALAGVADLCYSLGTRTNQEARDARWSGIKNLTLATGIGFLSAAAIKAAQK